MGDTLQKLKPIVKPAPTSDDNNSQGSDEVTDLPNLHGTGTPTSPLSAATANTAPPTPSAPLPSDTVPPTPGPPPDTGPDSEGSPRVTRSGKKRKLAAPCERKSKKKMTEDMMTELRAMMAGLERKIEASEVRTAEKIESSVNDLSGKLGARMDKAEEDIKSVAASLATIQKTTSDESLTKIVRRIVQEIPQRADFSRETGRRPRPFQPSSQTPRASTPGEEEEESEREDSQDDPSIRYWKARRQLRLWPVQGPDLGQSVREFLQNKLMMSGERVAALNFLVVASDARQDSPAQNQAVVTFETSKQRDEVRARAKNLDGGDRTTGCQLEPPDHLRGQYQVFQNLAFCLKKKTPNLKRNIKFYDPDQCLIMDVKTEAGWQTIEYKTAKNLLKKRTQRSNSMSRRDLREFLNDSDVRASGSEDENDVFNARRKNTPKNKRSCHELTFLNINARSLKPKFISLVDCFDEKQADFATVTETWLQSDRSTEDFKAEVRERYAMGIISRERSEVAANGRKYGGVAFIYGKATSNFQEFVLDNPDRHEVLASVGRVTGVKPKIFVISCYAPPNLPPDRAKNLLEYLSDVVCEAKRTYEDCLVVLSGDFNQWPAQEVVEDHPDLSEVECGPTRGVRSIDRSFVNFNRSIVESGTLPPLETEEGLVSDHDVAFCKAAFPKNNTEYVTYKHRPFTEEGAVSFLDYLSSLQWDEVLSAETVDQKTHLFQAALDQGMDKFFPEKTVRRRKSDPPWINDTLRRLNVKRRRIYDKHGRSRRWRALKKKSDDIYRQRAKQYLETQKKNLTGPDANRHFFKHIKSYSAREKPPEFQVGDLFPGEEDAAVAEKLADHFNAISKEFDGITEDQVPLTEVEQVVPILSRVEIENKLRSFRKPKSRVKGDIFPALVNRAAPWISRPLASIYNTISSTYHWPALWKTEFVTPIPKKTLPESPNDLRNISCTMFFSKVYESFVLQWLTGQTNLRPNQYGGVRGSGTEHFLVELWQKVLENLDDSRAGSFLSSIDYAKAFNRLDFKSCLDSLKEKGASQQLLRIVASFLSGRKMTVRVGSFFSSFRTVEGGVPQGSLLGVYLFNCTIDNFESKSQDVHPYGPVPPDAGPLPDDAPVLPPLTGRDHKHLAPFRELLLEVQKYVDDNIIHECINFDKIPTDGYTFRRFHATRTQNLFRRILAAAAACGMKVNSAKTTTMCIAEVKSYVPDAFFFDPDGIEIKTSSSMKILGFQFSNSPDMSAQVEEIKRKFRARMWALRHLGHRGMSAQDLVKVYKSVLLPCHDYCSVVYHSSLTATQAHSLERLQAQALKCIFGYQYSYRALLELSGLTSLEQRREERCNRFARKAAANPRYSGWFPEVPEGGRTLRRTNKYQEFRAKTTRLMNSPLYDLRRRLNNDLR